MDENNQNEGTGQIAQPNKAEQKKENVKEGAKAAGKAALNAYTGGVTSMPVIGAAVDKKLDKIANNPLVDKTIGNVASKIKGPAGKMLEDPNAGRMMQQAGNALGGKAGSGQMPQAGGASQPGQTMNNNQAAQGSDASPNQSGNSSPIPKAFTPSPLGNKPSDDQSATGDIASKIMKVKKYWPIISAVAPVVGWILATLIGLFLIMVPLMYLGEFIEKIQTGMEKFVNFVHYGNWLSNEDNFFDILQQEYKDFPKTTSNNVQLDVPLVAATIHYSKMLSSDQFEEENWENSDSKDDSNFNDLYGVVVEKDKTAAFYNVAVDKLGSVNTLYPGQKRLLGHLVKTEISLQCVDLDQVDDAWATTLNLIFKVGTATARDTFFESPLYRFTPIGFFDYYNKVKDYATIHGGPLAYYDYKIRNRIYEAKEFLYYFSELFDAANAINTLRGIADVIFGCGPRYETRYREDGTSYQVKILRAPAPVVERTMNYGELDDTTESGYKLFSYEDYLYHVYIPATYYYNDAPECKNKEETVIEKCKDRETRHNEIRDIIKEIFWERDFYLYLVGDGQLKYIGGASCEYNVDGQMISNLKVQLLQCSKGGETGGKEGDPIPGVDLVDFEKYILGVVYAEIGSSFPAEAQKVQAIAARSFALSRGREMGTSYLQIRQENGQWILPIRNCVADQVYCDPDEGCSRKFSDQWATLYPGENTQQDKYKGPLPADHPMRNTVAEVAGKTMVDSSGNIIPGYYVNTNQEKWKSQANSGMDYTEILIAEYDKLSEIQTNVCSSLVSDTDFSRPTVSGTITSNYGPRPRPCPTCSAYHEGIDIGIPTGTPVYASAAGTVSKITLKSSCGGNMVYVNHQVDGVGYTSVYMHLLSIEVQDREIVDKNTVIGYSGGDKATTPWDGCSTGAHLHFGLYNGLLGVDQISSFDPRTKVNFPAVGSSYSDRAT